MYLKYVGTVLVGSFYFYSFFTMSPTRFSTSVAFSNMVLPTWHLPGDWADGRAEPLLRSPSVPVSMHQLDFDGNNTGSASLTRGIFPRPRSRPNASRCARFRLRSLRRVNAPNSPRFSSVVHPVSRVLARFSSIFQFRQLCRSFSTTRAAASLQS